MATLFSNAEESYGAHYRDHLLEQYKLYVESIESTSDRRQHANSYFITINTVLVSFISLSSQIGVFERLSQIKSVLAAVGVVICIVFWYLIRSYKQLNTGKFEVVHEIETQLPLALYAYEWELLGRGKDKKKYFPFSHVELIIPWVFGVIYTAMGLYFLFA